MNNKELQLVTFEQAQRLKSAGFDWPTTAVFAPSYRVGDNRLGFCDKEAPEDWNKKRVGMFSAPTVALALKWMRDEKGMCGYVAHNDAHTKWRYEALQLRRVSHLTKLPRVHF